MNEHLRPDFQVEPATTMAAEGMPRRAWTVAEIEAMVREAEMQELEEKWKAQNERIMREHPDGGPPGTEQTGAYPAAPVPEPMQPASAEAKAISVDNPEEYRDMPGSSEKPEK